MTTPTHAPDGLSGGFPGPSGRRSSYGEQIAKVADLVATKGGTWDGISPEAVARMRLQNRFLTGLDIARYTAAHRCAATWPPMTPTRRITPSRWAPGTASSRSRR